MRADVDRPCRTVHVLRRGGRLVLCCKFESFPSSHLLILERYDYGYFAALCAILRNTCVFKANEGWSGRRNALIPITVNSRERSRAPLASGTSVYGFENTEDHAERLTTYRPLHKIDIGITIGLSWSGNPLFPDTRISESLHPVHMTREDQYVP